MPTIIDALIVTLGLDAKGFTGGVDKSKDDLNKFGDEAEKARKRTEEAAKKSVAAFANLRKEILGLVTLFTAGLGLKEFVSDSVQASAQVGRLAKNLDMSTEELSAWQGVLRRSGGSAQDASNDLQTLVGAFQSIQLTGNSPLIPYLNLLKISLADLKSPSGTLLKIADAFSHMDPAQAAAIGKGMGLSPAMISLLEKGSANLKAMLAEQRRIKQVSAEDAAAAQDFQDKLSTLKQESEALGNKILTALEPILSLLGRGLSAVAQLAQQNRPIILGLFAGIAAAAIAATIPLIAAGAAMFGITAATLSAAAPFLAVGVAIGVMVEAVMAAIRWFANLVHTNARLNAAWHELSATAAALASTVADDFRPLMPLFHEIGQAIGSVGSAIGDAFGAASRAVASGFINFLVGQFHVVADLIRAITALIHGDLRGAMGAAKDYIKDEVGSFTGNERPSAAAGAAAKPATAAPAGSTTSQMAANMIAGFEHFAGHAYWDRNAYRTGYGSDTVTDPNTGKVTRVTANTTVTRAQAEADLNRRVTTEFMPKVAAAVGGAWQKFSTATKAALTSVAYNYGHLPKDVLAAARTGNLGAISAAIRGHANDNAGINARRRYAEAAAIGGAPAATAGVRMAAATPRLASGAPARYAAGASTSTTTSSAVTNINGPITIHTAANDAAGIARDLSSELRKRTYVTQANTGLG